ncbi:MAG: gliding motility-associated C-terminal domain-containing protein [Cryomorphaceae bacterium]
MKFQNILWTLLSFLPFLGMAQGDNPNAPQLSIVGADQTINCTSDAVLIGVKVKHWQEGFVYQWAHGPTDSIVSVKPQQTRVYEINVVNEAIGYNATRSIEVKVFNAPVIVADEQITIDNKTCPGTDIQLGVDPIGGYAPYSYAWDSGHNEASPTVNPEVETTYAVTVTDVCGTQERATVTVFFEVHDALVAPLSKEISFQCEGEEIHLEAPVQATTGGVGYGYAYTFSDWTAAGTPMIASTSDGAEYTYQVTDACGIQVATSHLVLVAEELDAPTATDILVCEGQEAQITTSTDPFYFWDGQTMHTAYAERYFDDAQVALIFIDVCGETHHTSRQVIIDAVDTEFEMHLNHLDRNASLYAPVSARDQKITWYLNGKEISTDPDPFIEFLEVDENEIVLEIENENGCTERTARTVVLQDGVELPSAFSPNGDGLNDKFSVQFEDDLVDFNIKIFDRWGQLIYESRDQYFEWDGLMEGKVSPLTSYAYILRAETVEGREIEKRGTISTLIID